MAADERAAAMRLAPMRVAAPAVVSVHAWLRCWALEERRRASSRAGFVPVRSRRRALRTTVGRRAQALRDAPRPAVEPDARSRCRPRRTAVQALPRPSRAWTSSATRCPPSLPSTPRCTTESRFRAGPGEFRSYERSRTPRRQAILGPPRIATQGPWKRILRRSSGPASRLARSHNPGSCARATTVRSGSRKQS